MAGGLIGSQASVAQDRLEARLDMYGQALAAVEQEYVEPVETEQAVYSSIDGMLRTLDPHSSFLPPASFAQMRERQVGRYFGIGITIASLDGDVTVTSLFEGSPAYRAGIRRGDVIARVGVEEAKGWTTQQVVDRVKGPKGTTVDLAIRRPGVESLIELTVERDEITIRTVRTAFMMAPGIGYIRLQDFSDTTDRELGQALDELRRDGMQRLILDLRDNPGGPLDQAIAVSSRFLRENDLVVSTRGRLPNADEDYRAIETRTTDVPLVVIVNRQSASASEIVAGAIQDYDRGLVVGETTFGKALVQSVYPIANGAGLALTTGRYYTPAGRLIQRPWDGSFDEYMLYSQRDQTESREHAPEDLTYTKILDRKVYGGGGIEPDHFVPGPVEGFNPTRYSRRLYQRSLFISFAERFTREGDDRPGSARSSAAHVVAPGWELTDALLEEFRDHLAAVGATIDEAAFEADREFIRAMIRFEVDNDLFSVEEARRNLSRVDPQIQAALGYLEEAAQLREQVMAAAVR
jgi:carboxyl-terminal processing protease